MFKKHIPNLFNISVRFVFVHSADGRKGGVSVDTGEAWQFAQRIADLKMEKDLAYIIDICE
ncbi:MAG: hypothetical protein IKA12_01265, partial [Clostridia bacterium]|nr:hypothetical protein [Clostridia bacterium]